MLNKANLEVTNRTTSAIVNSIAGFVCLVIPIFLQFFSRKYFLEYLNVDYLGVSGTFTSLLSTLSLSELGIQTAVVYCLYKPLADRDEPLINSFLTVMRVIYRWIGIAFMAFPLLALPFLKYILKGTEVDIIIAASFVAVSFSSAFTYFLSYKRCLLFADQKEYISKTIDLIFNILFIVIQIISLIYLRSFLMWCVIGCVQVIISNIVIQIICKRLYPFLRHEAMSKSAFLEVWSYTKNIIISRFAAYVYLSTDNLVISSLLGVSYVGLLGNYSVLTTKLTTIANGMLVPVQPIIGNMYLEHDAQKNERILRVFTFVRLLVATVIIVPFLTVIDDLIRWWIGEKYLLPDEIKYLLAADLYINLYYTACCDFIGAAGLFDKDRNLALIGSVINIVTSIILVYLIGLSGVIVGTIISQMYFWAARSFLAFKYCMDNAKSKFYQYWGRAIMNFLIISFCVVLSLYFYGLTEINNAILKMMGGVLIAIGVTSVIYTTFYSKTMETSYLLHHILRKP